MLGKTMSVLEGHSSRLGSLLLEAIAVGFGVVEGDPVFRDVALK